MSKENTLAKVDKALSNGTLWRAKEILQGNIACSPGYDAEIYERYGQVLLQMGDLLEAGKYLFLSGKKEPTYEEPIELYLRRFAKPGLHILYYTFPRNARLPQLKDYPDAVEERLRSLGYEDKWLKKYVHKPAEPPTVTSKVKSKLLGFFLLLILVAFIIGVVQVTINGFQIIIKWLFH